MVWETSSGIREKLSSSREAVREEVKVHLREGVEPVRADDTKKTLILRAARLFGLTAKRAKRLWYGDFETIPGDELDRIRAKALLLRQDREKRLDAELTAVRERIAQLELDL